MAVFAMGITFQACDDTKTYAEMLDEERDAINAFIRDSSIVVITQSQFHAQDSITYDNEYVQLASGVYMHIDRKCTGWNEEDQNDPKNKAAWEAAAPVVNNNIVLVRFSEYDIIGKYTAYSNTDLAYTVDAFRYTETSSSIAATFTEGYYMYNTGSLSTAVPAGRLVAFSYVRDGARLKLIVPSKMGSSSAMSAVYPYYYDIRKFQIY